jgi:hypothetical protein
MKFCPSCGQEKFSTNLERNKTSQPKPNSSIKQDESFLQKTDDTELCTHSFKEAKSFLYKDKYDSENRLFCGLCKKEFTRDKFLEKKQVKNNWRIPALAGIVLVFVFAAMSQNSNSGYSATDQRVSDEFFDQPAQQLMNPWGINTTIGSWGISLEDSYGPRTLGDIVQDMWYYLNANASGSGNITKEDMEIALQPGNSVYNILQTLFVDQSTIDEVSSLLIQLSE